MGREHAEAAAGDTATSSPAQSAGRAAGQPAGTSIPPDPSGGPDQAHEEVTDRARAEEMTFNITVEIVYNRARASFLIWCHRVLLFGTIAAGTSAAADLWSVKLLAALAATFGLLDLVFDPATTAAQHRDITRVQHATLIKLRRARFSPEAMVEADAVLLDLSATEPAPFEAQRAIAYNQTIASLGRDEANRIPLTRTRRVLSQWLRFEGS